MENFAFSVQYFHTVWLSLIKYSQRLGILPYKSSVHLGKSMLSLQYTVFFTKFFQQFCPEHMLFAKRVEPISFDNDILIHLDICFPKGQQPSDRPLCAFTPHVRVVTVCDLVFNEIFACMEMKCGLFVLLFVSFLIILWLSVLIEP